jgi:hypothetical protein
MKSEADKTFKILFDMRKAFCFVFLFSKCFNSTLIICYHGKCKKCPAFSSRAFCLLIFLESRKIYLENKELENTENYLLG